ncbi:hypothetical protein [Weissella cibaria]|nr:hypothetical protein [Weissella cibaria]
MKDILPGMTVHLPVRKYNDTTITVNGHNMIFKSIDRDWVRCDTICMLGADTENETVCWLEVLVHQF